MVREEPYVIKAVDWDRIQRHSCVNPQPLPIDKPCTEYNDKQLDTTCVEKNPATPAAYRKSPVAKRPCSGPSSRAGGARAPRPKPPMKSYPTKKKISTDCLIEIERDNYRDFVTALRNAEMIAWNNEVQKQKLETKKRLLQQERDFGAQLAIEQSRWIADEGVRAQWVRSRNQQHVADVTVQMNEKAADKKLEIDREIAKAVNYRKAVEIEDFRIREETAKKVAEQKRLIHDTLTREIQVKRVRQAVEKEKEKLELQINRLYNDFCHRKESLLKEVLNKNHFNNSFLSQHHKRLQEINQAKQNEYQTIMSGIVEQYQRVKNTEKNLLEEQMERPKNFCNEYLTAKKFNLNQDKMDLVDVLNDAEMAKDIALEEADERRRNMMESRSNVKTGEHRCLKNDVDAVRCKLQTEREILDEMKQKQFLEYANRTIKDSKITSSPTYPIERFIEKYCNDKTYQPTNDTIGHNQRRLLDGRNDMPCVLPGIIPSGRAEVPGWRHSNR